LEASTPSSKSCSWFITDCVQIQRRVVVKHLGGKVRLDHPLPGGVEDHYDCMKGPEKSKKETIHEHENQEDIAILELAKT
jgi:hypothetical protein